MALAGYEALSQRAKQVQITNLSAKGLESGTGDAAF